MLRSDQGKPEEKKEKEKANRKTWDGAKKKKKKYKSIIIQVLYMQASEVGARE